MQAYLAAFACDRGAGSSPAKPALEAKAAKGLLGSVGLDRALRIVERTFAPDSYWRGKGVTLSQIARDPDRFDRDHTQSTQKTGQARRYNGRRPAQQGGTPIVNPASVLEVVA